MDVRYTQQEYHRRDVQQWAISIASQIQRFTLEDKQPGNKWKGSGEGYNK